MGILNNIFLVKKVNYRRLTMVDSCRQRDFDDGAGL